ncbi:MAG: YceI family protein [Candidatus Acidiferrum sp.]
MKIRFLFSSCLAIALAAAGSASIRADDFSVDDAHQAFAFKISHLGLSWTHGRFGDVSGTFTIDASDPSKSAFNLTIKTESVDTGNKKRDDHLRSPDFFNVKQYPVITFKSTSVKRAAEGLEVTGDLTMHGVTKSITFPLKGGRTAQFPPGIHRTGYSTELVLKRGEFGIKTFAGPVGDDVYVSISFEGVKK